MKLIRSVSLLAIASCALSAQAFPNITLDRPSGAFYNVLATRPSSGTATFYITGSFDFVGIDPGRIEVSPAYRLDGPGVISVGATQFLLDGFKNGLAGSGSLLEVTVDASTPLGDYLIFAPYDNPYDNGGSYIYAYERSFPYSPFAGSSYAVRVTGAPGPEAALPFTLMAIKRRRAKRPA